LPNLLFVLTDDQAAWAVGAYGNADIHTPNMDRLAREGVLFRYAATCPVCSPSRGMILSGRYPHQIGLDDWISPQETEGIDPKVPLLPEVLKQAGYTTGLIGKWHLGQGPEHHPLQRGFDFFMGFLGGSNAPKDPTLEVEGKTQHLKGFLIELMAEEALRFLRGNRHRPFALFFHTREPHMPYTPVPEQDLAPYQGKRFRTPKVPGFPEERLQEEYRHYYASITSIDRNLGRLLEALDEMALAENTLVIFMGDNGYMIGHHGLETKGNAWTLAPPRTRRPNMFEESIFVPLILRWPAAIRPGQVREEMVSSLDFMPTFLDILRAAGASVPRVGGLEGMSLMPLLLGEQGLPWREELYLLYDMHHGATAHMRMVRTREWKLVLHLEEGGQHELYHLAEDAREERNLYGDPQVEAVQRDLEERLWAWQRRVKDPLATT